MNSCRRYQRIYFRMTDGLILKVRGPTEQTSWTAHLMDLGEGGLCLSRPKAGGTLPVEEGMPVELTDAEGADGLDALVGLTMEIRWVLSLHQSRYILFGGEFKGHGPDLRGRIISFMESWTSSPNGGEIDENL